MIYYTVENILGRVIGFQMVGELGELYIRVKLEDFKTTL